MITKANDIFKYLEFMGISLGTTFEIYSLLNNDAISNFFWILIQLVLFKGTL